MACYKKNRYENLALFFAILAAFVQPGNSLSQDFEFGNNAKTESEIVLFHPGIMTYNDDFVLETFYTRPFNLKELDTRSGILSIPMGCTRLGISFSSFGSKKFSETSGGFLLSWPILGIFGFSAEMKLFSTSITGYENKTSVNLNGGLFLKTEPVFMGIRYLNSGQNKISVSGAKNLPGFHLFFSAKLSKRLITEFGILNQEKFRNLYAWENRVALHEAFNLVFGISDNPSGYTFGLELIRGKFRFLYQFKDHSDLGITSQLGLSIGFSANGT